MAQVYVQVHVHASCMRQYWSTINIIIYFRIIYVLFICLSLPPLFTRFLKSLNLEKLFNTQRAVYNNKTVGLKRLTTLYSLHIGIYKNIGSFF